MDTLFEDKVAIVTGASSGIGEAMVRALAQRRCHVVAAARTEASLNRVTEEIGGRTIAVPTNVSDRGEVDRMVETTVSQFGGIDILVANAGLFSMSTFSDMDPDDIDNLIDVNVSGVMRCVHAALPHLRARETSDIIIVGSIAGITELPLESVYSPTKHALQSFAHILRRELRKENVRVGLICPGTVATPLWGERSEAQIQSRIDQHEEIRAEDVAETAMFMLRQPRHVAIRDVVILPQGQDV